MEYLFVSEPNENKIVHSLFSTAGLTADYCSKLLFRGRLFTHLNQDRGEKNDPYDSKPTCSVLFGVFNDALCAWTCYGSAKITQIAARKL